MALYMIRRSALAITAGNDVMTLITASNRKMRLWEVSASGLGTTSAANEFFFGPSTAGTTGGGALTPTPVDPDSVAAGMTVNTTWSAQPTLGAHGLAFGVNANGGTYRWVARSGEEIVARNGHASAPQLSYRVVSGSSTITTHVVIEEF